ncbi:arylsulfatase [Achromobacter sp. MFA1 R4]|uniref:arylsulfatase n=1 Tax=Achromobacter sp. MFA1 R4 TaxID=1881016 RepID=UPI000953822E|nr:arylsulfatase [Achromobacter sp. MFA1 R4]SIT28077.1 arylsulfatase [Achromobacter sp. MFA1 R4]
MTINRGKLMQCPWRQIATALMTVLATAGIAAAQQTNAPLGSPAATRAIDGLQLPAPDVPFGGKIERNAMQSTPFWQPRIVPPNGAPNVLLIITDDVGFGAPATFGGVIPTPALDKIAAMGLRYTNMHSTALCSPTRAALITGRNHHSSGFGVISEQATGYPGYDSVITKDKATVGTILKSNGYNTSWFGKNHNTPGYQVSMAGPFDQWPTGMGFDYFYGFMGGDTSQWTPGNLFRNTTQIYPYESRKGYNLITAMADEAIDYMSQLNALAPDQPWLVYYAPGGTHAPHHPTPEWIKQIEDMHLFDDGWNKLRDTIFANQKKLGVIPQTAELTPWPSDLLKNWDQLTDDEKKMFIRQANVYAAYLAYTDAEIGRVIQAVEDAGELDNTLIIYISGDNGSSAEGTLLGTPNEVAMFNGVEVPVSAQLKHFYDLWGSEHTYNHMAVPWSWAFDTPFKWTKQISSYFGGTRQGMAIAWPKVITDKGGIRNQFAHVIDIAPTILEAAAIREPSVVDGIAQSPMEGSSLMYTFDAVNAKVPARHLTQYFEMFGNYAIYHEGWMLVDKISRPSWVTAGPQDVNPAKADWELYNINTDWTQNHDVAARHPEKVKELEAVWWREARKYNVMPLDASVVSRLVTPRPSSTAGRSDFTFPGRMTGISNGVAPSILNASYTFTAEVTVPEGGGEGMIITQGGRFTGYGLFLRKGKPTFVWNLFGLQKVAWEAPDALAPGKHTLVFDFNYDGLGAATLAFNDFSGIGKGGTGELKVDGAVVAKHKMEYTVPLILAWDENMDIGSDTGTPVDDAAYAVPFAFTGSIDSLNLIVNRPVLSDADKARLEEAMKKASD